MLDAFQRILQGLEIIAAASWLTCVFESIFIYANGGGGDEEAGTPGPAGGTFAEVPPAGL